MRTIIGITAVLAWLTLFTGPPCLMPSSEPAAEEPDLLSETERRWLDENPEKIILWYDKSYPPIEYQNEQGSFDGMGADVMTLIEEILDVEFIRIASPDWNLQLESLRKGESAIAPVIVPTEERSEYAFFSNPYISIPAVIITRRGGENFDSLETLYGRKVAVVSGFVSENYLRENYKDRFEIVAVDNITEGLNDVSFGVVDAMVENLAVAAYYIEKEKLPNLEVAGYTDLVYDQSFAVSRKYPLLYSAMVKALNTIPADELDDIEHKWIYLKTGGLSGEQKRQLLFIAAVLLSALILMVVFSWILKRRLAEKQEALVRSERELRVKSERLQLALDLANDGLWDWNITTGELFLSPRFYTMLGYRSDDFDSEVELWRALVHPDDAASIKKATDDTEAGKGPFSIEIRMKDKAGSWHRILSRGGLVESQDSKTRRIVGTHVDITDLKKAEEARIKAEKRYREIFNNAPVGIFRTTYSGRIIEANPSMIKVLGYSDHEDLITSIKSLRNDIYAREGERDRFLKLLKENPDGMIMETEFRRKDGSVIYGNMSAYLHFDREGNPDYIYGTFEDITEKRAAKIALEISEMRFRTLYEIAQDSIVILDHGKIIDLNPSFQRLLDKPHSAIIGRRPSDLSPKYQPDGRKSSLREQEIINSSREGLSLLFDWVFLRSDNTDVSVEVSLQQMLLQDSSYQLAMIRDVTERRRAEIQLKQSEEKFSRLFMLSPDAVVLIKYDTQLIYDANKTFISKFGYQRNDVIGMTFTETGLFADSRKQEAFFGATAKSEFMTGFEADMMHRNGSVITVSVSAQIIDIDETPYILMVLHDVTEIKKMNEMMIQTEKMISVGGIAAGIAHEINNPLGIVLQSAQNLERRIDSEFPKNIKTAESLGLDISLLSAYTKERKLDVFIADIKAASLRAADIIRNMLDFSRRSESNRVVCDIVKLTETAVELASNDYSLKKNYDFKKIKITREYEDNLPELECTVTEIEQVLLNLLKNAAQAMHKAESPPESPEITIRIKYSEMYIHIGIEDNGPGIPEKDIKRIFEPFYTTKSPGEGTGLGLSVSYFIITKGHDGKMWVSSGSNRGAVFNIMLPVKPKAEAGNE